MTEFLSREKELFKLNAELDAMTTQAFEKATTVSSTKTVARYLTYTKTRGPGSSPLDKSSGGINDKSIVRDLRLNKKLITLKDRTLGSINEVRAGALVPSSKTVTTVRKNVTSGVNVQQATFRATPNRNSGSRLSNTTTALVAMYQNRKFKESPSLENLAKKERLYLISDKAPPCSPAPASDLESLTSISNLGMIQSAYSSTVSKIERIPKNLSSEGLIKFLKSKLTILKVDHDKLTQEMTQQKEILENSMKRQKKLEAQREQAYAKHNSIKDQVATLETQLAEAENRLKEREAEYSAQHNDLEAARREIKILTQTNTNLDKRLHRLNEELENTRNDVTILKNADREIREKARLDNESHEKHVKSLKKQRADLLSAYKKQLFLIDNLKRQNLCMEQSRMIAFGEKEFTKVLEWSSKK